MCLIFTTELLLLSLIIQITTAENEQKYIYKNPLNVTFLPYTLKIKENRNVNSDNFPDLVVFNNDEDNKYEVLENNELKYEKNNENANKPETSNWKHLTSAYLLPYPLLKQQSDGYDDQNEFLSKTHTNLYGQQQLSSTALIGSSNFKLAHTLFSIINLVIFSYMLFGIVALLNRLLSYVPTPVFSTYNGFGGIIYKNNKK